MNANIVKVDELMKSRSIKFSVACKAYKLIRRGMSVDAALVIANAREGKELLKQQRKDDGMKRKNEKSLEELVEEMEKKAELIPSSIFVELVREDLALISTLDALNHVNHEATRRLNSPRIGKDALDLCYSNTDGAEVLF